MRQQGNKKHTLVRGVVAAWLVAGLLAMAGCASSPARGNDQSYGTQYGAPPVTSPQSTASSQQPLPCDQTQCGTVQSVRQVQVGKNSHHILGTAIGAVAGGLLGHQVGGGKGKEAATAAGAVAGGIAGHEVAKKRSGSNTGYQVVVKLDDGRTATVTQRENPDVEVGDQVEIRDNHVYER